MDLPVQKIKIATKLKNSVQEHLTDSDELLDSDTILVPDEQTKFHGVPTMQFVIGMGRVMIYKTLKGDGFWVTGDTKDHKLIMKTSGGKWVPSMSAWLFSLTSKYNIVPYLMDKSLGL